MLARISKAKPWTVVCGVRDCGAHLAFIVWNRMQPPRRWLIMAPDWGPRYDDRVWAKKKRQQARGKNSDYRQFWIIRALPVEIACGTCGLRQILSNDVLRVDAEDAQTFKGIPTTCPSPRCSGQSLPGQACPECDQINTRRPEPGHPMELTTFNSLLADTEARYTTSNSKTE